MENYSDLYERLKKTGAHQAILFMPKPENVEEKFVPVTDLQIPGVDPDRYLISNYGNIFDTYSDRYLSQHFDQDGYCKASFSTVNGYKNKFVHRIELLSFDYREDANKLQVNHQDTIKNNNKLSNLEWTTPKENSDHAMIYGLHSMNGEKNPNSKLTEEQVHEICKLIETGEYYDTEIAKMYNVSYTNISDIHKGKIWVNVSRNYNLNKRKALSLTPEQVHEICKLLESSDYNNAEIGKMYNTSANNIREIRIGKIWTDISQNYNIKREAVPKKFTKDKVREICELMQTGQYYDKEIAQMYNTTSTFIRGLRIGLVHKDITKDYDMTIRKTK